METILYNQLWQLKARLLCSFLLGLVTLSAQAQQPVITQASANDAAPPLFTNVSISTVIEGGTGPFTYELTNAHTEDLVTSGTVGQNLTGFTRIGNYSTQTYYRSTGSYSTYEQASSAAIAQGGHLLAINSAAEQNWLTTNGGWVAGDHLGASDQNIEGTFVWSNGQPLTYTNWAPNEPNNGGGNQDYMQIYANGTWDDVSWNYTGTVRVLAEIPNDIQVDNLLPGSYLLRVTDSQGHEDTNTFEIGPGITIFNTSVSDVSCNDGGDGQVVVNLEGGVPPYTYEWSNGQSGSLPQAIEGFELLGEFGEKIYYLSNSGFPSYDAAAELADSYLGYIAAVNSAAENNWLINTGGWPAGVIVGGTDRDIEGTWTWESGEPFSYSNWAGGEPNDWGSGEDYIQILAGGNWNDIPWITNRQVLFELSYFVSGDQLAAGEHTLTITDNNGSQVSQTFTISEPEPFSVEFDMTAVSGCGSNGDGAVVADVDGGTTPYTYAWETGATTSSISGLDVGFYTLTTTDSNGCVFEADANVIAGDTDGPIVIAQNVVIALDENGTAELSPDDADNGTYDDCDESPELLLSRRMVIPINSSSDDVEEATNGNIYDDSSDLEFFYDGQANGGEQIIGLRFENIDLPAGTVINNAYIQFFTEDQNLDGAAPTAIIELENSANASSFLWYENYNVSSRDYLDESVSWDMPVWDVTALNGPEQRTPDLSSLIQQIVNLDGWQQGNSVAFMLSSPNPILSNLGNTAATYDENPNAAPKLVIEFASPTREFNCSDIGEHTGYLTAVDDAGNVSTVNFMLTVVDEIAPTALASGQTVYLDENGEGSITLDMVDNGSFDNCGIANRTLSKTAFTCQDIGEQIVSLVVTDVHGNTDQAVIVVNVVDGIAPDAEVTNTTAYVDENGWVQLNVDEMLTVTNENCGVADLVINEELFSCQDVGVTSLNIEVSDFAGNTSTFNPQLIIADTIKPTFMTTAIDLFLNDEGTAELNNELLMQYASDNCAIESIETDNTFFTCDADGNAQTANVTVTDVHGNVTQRQIGVFVIDAEAPDVTVSDMNLDLGEDGVAELSSEMLDMEATDNCGIASTQLSQTSFDCTDGPFTVITVTCTDFAGNSRQETFTVNITDNVTPVISGPDNFEFCEGVAVSYDGIVVEDNCQAQLILTEGPSNGSTPDAGEYTAAFMAVDAAGNMTTKEVMVMVHAEPVFDLGPTLYAEPGSLVQLGIDPFGEGYTYEWSNGDDDPSTNIEVTQSINTVTLTVTSPEGCSYSDTIQILVDPTMSVDDPAVLNGVMLYPNPTTGALAVEFNLTDAKENIQITVSDLSGKTVLIETIPLARNGEQVFLDLRNLANGYYVVNILADQLNVSERVMKQ